MEWLYLRPAAERADAATRPQSSPPPAGVPLTDGVPDRATFVARMAAEFGKTPAHWERVHDQWQERVRGDRAR